MLLAWGIPLCCNHCQVQVHFSFPKLNYCKGKPGPKNAGLALCVTSSPSMTLLCQMIDSENLQNAWLNEKEDNSFTKLFMDKILHQHISVAYPMNSGQCFNSPKCLWHLWKNAVHQQSDSRTQNPTFFWGGGQLLLAASYWLGPSWKIWSSRIGGLCRAVWNSKSGPNKFPFITLSHEFQNHHNQKAT